MMTEQALKEAILACEGDLDPNANTCRTLAALYTIRDHMFGGADPRSETYSGQPQAAPVQIYSRAAARDSGSEFIEIAETLDPYDLIDVMDELMSAVQILHPRLYNGTMRKLRDYR